MIIVDPYSIKHKGILHHAFAFQGGMGIPYTQIIGGLAETGFGLAGGFGDKPDVAKWRRLNYGLEGKKGLQANIGFFPDLTELSNLYRGLSTSQMESLLPGYGANLAAGEKASGQLLSRGQELLSGQIPQDVIDQMMRADAYTGLMSGGYGDAGGEIGRNRRARDLGLTSLQLMQRGAEMIGQGGNSAQQWARMAGNDILNPGAFMITPQQQAAFDMQNNLLRQQSLQNLYNRNAAPDPTMLGLMSISSQFTGGGMGSFGSPGDAGTAYSSPSGSSFYGPNRDVYGFG